MKIKRELLTELVNTVYKGVGNNKIIPITQMMGVIVLGSELSLASTDSTNYFKGKMNLENSDNVEFNVCVNADLFTKLINKFTTEFVEITLNESAMKVVGDGDYELELLLDEEGKVFAFPLKEFESEFDEVKTLEVKQVEDIKTQCEKALAITMENPSLVNYYLGDNVIATDSLVMAVYANKLFDSDRLLTPKAMNLLVLMKDKITIGFKTNKLYAKDSTFELVGDINSTIDDYPVEAIKGLLESVQFDSKAKFKVSELNSVLDRLSLFVTQYDDGVINLKFDDNYIYASTLKSKGVERIKLDTTEPIKSYMCGVDIEMVKNQLASFTEEHIEISFGNASFIQLKSGNVSKLIALTEN